ncbi:MAG: hypothetical protein B7Z37_05210 [Verrucomicrobia bacterium 12-59-8]|nr:MAG: hypothetical protein B7Z37_05210 [Verrucomicrobia bacterium 12-59-8]
MRHAPRFILSSLFPTFTMTSLATLRCSFLAAAIGFTTHIAAEDWGAYVITPVSALAMVLEAVDSGTGDGTYVSIGNPAGAPNQKWFIVPKGDGFYAIKPSYSSTLTLAVAEGGVKNGTNIVLETDSGKPWQQWQIQKNDAGSYSIIPRHAPTHGMDDLGGKKEPGAKIDLWQHNPNDQHLQWQIKPLAGTAIAGAEAASAEPTYVAPVIKPEDILPGTIKQTQFNQSKVFPGTVRDVTVFIPAQYDGSTLPAPMKGTMDRRNRDLEYDGVGDENVRFLVDELLPFVAKEFDLKLSTDGNDRCISGGSSGGIAAFTAAWHRPEAFSRVYAASGSWVAFRGGHEFPTMVRKFEAKPIRAYLTTATHDMENCAGDWYLLDLEMDKALKFSGYDYQFRSIEGRHVAGYGENYLEAMAFLWKGWPERVKAGTSAPRAQEVIVPGEGWELLAEGFKSTRGPSCNENGEVFFADTSNNKIHRIDLDGKVSEFVGDTNAHCVTMGADGKLYTISEKSGKLMSFDATGAGSVVMEEILGHSILAMPNGGLYVTTNGDKPKEEGTVWYVKDGKKTQVDRGIKFATGMAYRPDQWLLTVAEGHSKWAYSYQINDDGTLANKERFFHLYVADWEDDAGPECVCYSLEGRQFIATKSGVQISADDGPTQIILPVPDRSRVTAVAIGGKDKDMLFAFCGNKIWKRKILQHAMGAWSPWTKMTGSKL